MGSTQFYKPGTDTCYNKYYENPSANHHEQYSNHGQQAQYDHHTRDKLNAHYNQAMQHGYNNYEYPRVNHDEEYSHHSHQVQDDHHTHNNLKPNSNHAMQHGYHKEHGAVEFLNHGAHGSHNHSEFNGLSAEHNSLGNIHEMIDSHARWFRKPPPRRNGKYGKGKTSSRISGGDSGSSNSGESA